jgi:hypothetical protein
MTYAEGIQELRDSLALRVITPGAQQFVGTGEAAKSPEGLALALQILALHARRAGREPKPNKETAVRLRAEARASYELLEPEYGTVDAFAWVKDHFKRLDEKALNSACGDSPKGEVRTKANELKSDQKFRSGFFARLHAE